MGKTTSPTKKTAEKTAKTSPRPHIPAVEALLSGKASSLPALIERVPTTAGGAERVVISEAGCELARSMAAAGYTKQSVARVLGIGMNAFYRCLKDQPEFGDAYRQGLAQEEELLVGKLRQLAESGNVVAILFALKAKHGWREGDSPDAPTTNVVINLPDAMSEEAYREMIAVEHVPSGDDE